jgi:hypothetical protein
MKFHLVERAIVQEGEEPILMLGLVEAENDEEAIALFHEKNPISLTFGSREATEEDLKGVEDGIIEGST